MTAADPKNGGTPQEVSGHVESVCSQLMAHGRARAGSEQSAEVPFLREPAEDQLQTVARRCGTTATPLVLFAPLASIPDVLPGPSASFRQEA